MLSLISTLFLTWLAHGNGFLETEEIRFQNAATSLDENWKIPAYGEPLGNIRMEPVALGGIEGKGLWLDGESALRYQIQEQPTEVANHPWYIGFFLDSRFKNDGQERTALTFPDGTSLTIKGRNKISFNHADATAAKVFSLPPALRLPMKGWTHISLLIENGGLSVTLYINGYAYGR